MKYDIKVKYEYNGKAQTITGRVDLDKQALVPMKSKNADDFIAYEEDQIWSLIKWVSDTEQHELEMTYDFDFSKIVIWRNDVIEEVLHIENIESFSRK